MEKYALGKLAGGLPYRMHGDNGGDEETGREVLRLVPTHCGREDSAVSGFSGPGASQ